MTLSGLEFLQKTRDPQVIVGARFSAYPKNFLDKF